MNKKCFKCGEIKPLTKFYKHSGMKDGHLNKCKLCAMKDSNELRLKNLSNSEWVKKEKERQKLKNKNYSSKYPEIIKAHNASRCLKKIDSSNVFHHWSYNKIDWLSVFEMSDENHKFLHRFIYYDSERMMFRCVMKTNNFESGELLDTKKRHISYFKEIWIKFNE